MLEEEALDVGRARQCSVITSLVYVESVACGADSKLLEVNSLSFVVLDGADLVKCFVSDLWVSGGNAKVVDLAAEEDLVALVGHLADVALVGSGGKAHFSQDMIDVSFPEGPGFRVALKRMADGENHGAVKLDAMAFKTPFGIGIVDHDVGRDAGCRGVGVGIAGISSEDLHVEGGGEGHEETHARMLDTGRVGAGEAMEFRGSALGAIATVASTTSAIGFDFAHPMLAEDNGAGGARARFAVHLEIGEAIELLAFGIFPEWPGGQVAELATCEGAKGTFGRTASGR